MTSRGWGDLGLEADANEAEAMGSEAAFLAAGEVAGDADASILCYTQMFFVQN